MTWTWNSSSNTLVGRQAFTKVSGARVLAVLDPVPLGRGVDQHSLNHGQPVSGSISLTGLSTWTSKGQE